MKCTEIMTKDVITINKDERVEVAVKKIMDYKITGLPVVDNGHQLVGIITESDIILKNRGVDVPTNFFPSFYPLAFTEDFPEGTGKFEKKIKELISSKVADVMTKMVYTVKGEDSIEEAVKIMSRKSVRRVPVIEGDQIIGIITQRDIINAYANNSVNES